MRPPAPWKPVSNAAFAAGLFAAAAMAILFSRDADGYLLGLDDLNLAFHEAGHLIFGVFGSTAGLYGGTAGQLVFPVSVAVSFYMRSEAAGFFAGLLWIFENVLNIARYLGDARAQNLPLLGGEHDWTNILSRWGLLSQDAAIAGFLRFAAWAGVVGACFWLFRRWNESPSAPPSSL